MEPPVVGLLAKYVSAGRGRLVHRRKTKESRKLRQTEAYSGRLPPECQRPWSDAQMASQSGVFEVLGARPASKAGVPGIAVS